MQLLKPPPRKCDDSFGSSFCDNISDSFSDAASQLDFPYLLTYSQLLLELMEFSIKMLRLLFRRACVIWNLTVLR